MIMYPKMLESIIQSEIKRVSYIKNDHDFYVCQQLLEEVNALCGTSFQYLCELALFKTTGTGKIVKKYIKEFFDEGTKGCLLHILVSEREKDTDYFILELYKSFKKSKQYISGLNQPAPAGTVASYDNAFKRLKSKRIKNELLELARCPRDVIYLPLTMQMLSSWKITEMKELLIGFLDESKYNCEDFGLPNSSELYYPSLATMQRNLLFIGISGLSYYPGEDVILLISQLEHNGDKSLLEAINKTLAILRKKCDLSN